MKQISIMKPTLALLLLLPMAGFAHTVKLPNGTTVDTQYWQCSGVSSTSPCNDMFPPRQNRSFVCPKGVPFDKTFVCMETTYKDCFAVSNERGEGRGIVCPE